MSINGHKTSCTRTMYLIKKEKKKIHNILTTSLKKKKKNNNNTPPNKMIPKTNFPPKSDYSHIQNYSPFLSWVTKGRVSSRHLIGRASISIIIWSVIVITIINIIILSIGIGSNWMRWWRNRLRCNTTDTNVHLIQLHKECIQASIHALQLHQDISQRCITGRVRNGYRWSRPGWSRMRGGCCWIRLSRPKLGLATFNGSVVYGTHDGKMVGRGKRNGKMA